MLAPRICMNVRTRVSELAQLLNAAPLGWGSAPAGLARTARA